MSSSIPTTYRDSLANPPKEEACNILHTLPPEIIQNIFARLDFPKLLRVGEVCCGFRNIIDDPVFLKGVFLKFLRRWAKCTFTIDRATQIGCYTISVRATKDTKVALSADGSKISVAADNIIQVWNLKTGDCRVFRGQHTNEIRSMIFSSDTSKLAAVAHTTQVWNLKTGDCRDFGHTDPIVLSPDGSRIAYNHSCGSKHIIVRDVKTGGYVAEKSIWTYSIAFSPDASKIASFDSHTVTLWNLETDDCKVITEHYGRISSIAFSPDGTTIASTDDRGVLKLCDLHTGKERLCRVTDNFSCIRIAFSPDGMTIAAAAKDDLTITLFDLEKQTSSILEKRTFDKHEVRSLTFCRDGSKIVSTAYNTIRIWDVNTGDCRIINTDTDLVACSPDGSVITSCSRPRWYYKYSSREFVFKIWCLPNGKKDEPTSYDCYASFQ